MNKILVEELIGVYKSKKYKIFHNGITYNFNLGVIRPKLMVVCENISKYSGNPKGTGRFSYALIEKKDFE